MRASAPGAMPSMGLVDQILAEASASGQSLPAWGVAWARVLPTALFVPIFGAGFLPASLRAALALGIAVSVAPAVAVVGPDVPIASLLVTEFLRGVPVALVAATVVWAALVAGGVTELALSGPPGTFARGIWGGPVATLFGLAAAALFLQGGGATLVAERLAHAPPDVLPPLAAAATRLTTGVAVGVGIGAPLLVVAALVDVAMAIGERELGPGLLASAVPPLRSLAVLVATAALFERILEAFVRFGSG